MNPVRLDSLEGIGLTSKGDGYRQEELDGDVLSATNSAFHFLLGIA